MPRPQVEEQKRMRFCRRVGAVELHLVVLGAAGAFATFLNFFVYTIQLSPL